MSKAPLKIGVVGVGIGRTHIRSYQAVPNEAIVVALCDVNETRLNEAADEYRIPLRYTDYQEMFTSGEVEAVSICLPNSLHGPISIAALEAGLHVLCEKPLADSIAAGQSVVEAAAKASSKFMICFNRRYRADIRWIKGMLDEGKLGQVYQVKAGWIRETGIPSGWFTNKAVAGGGPLIDLGVHMLDAVLWLLDFPEPLTVSGMAQSHFGPRGQKTWVWHRNNPTGEFTVEDSATAFIRLAGGISLTLETSWASHARPGQDDFYISLFGTEGTIELYVKNYAAEDTLTFYTELNGVPVATHPMVKGVKADHDYAIAEFVHCVREDRLPTATAEEGQTILQIIDAIYRSTESEREVVLAGPA